MLLIGVSIWTTGLPFFLLGVSARILSGLGYACAFTVSTLSLGVAIAQTDYPDQLNEVLGMIEFSAGLGMMVGPAVGSLVYYFLGFIGVFLALAGLYIVTIPALYCGIGPDREYIESRSTNETVNVYTNPRLVVNSLAMGYAMALISFFDAAIAPHLANFGLTTVQIGLILALTDAGYTLASLVLSRILRYLSVKWVLSAGLLLTALAYCLIGPWELLFPSRLWIVIVGIVCLSVSVGIVVVSTMPNLVKVATASLGLLNDDPLAEALSSKVQVGMLATYMSLGEVVGPLLGGYLVDAWGFPNSAAIMSGLGLLLLAMFLASERRQTEDIQPILTSES